MFDLSKKLDEGVREGMHLAFENNAFEHCDGADDPEDRCPSEGTCVCAYMHWKNLPWWKRPFVKQPPRATVTECQAMVFGRMIEQAIEDSKIELRSQTNV